MDAESVYDGIWACSSILHVEKDDLSDMLAKMFKALKTSGAVYTAFKIGSGYGIDGGRYYNYLTCDELMSLLKGLGEKVQMADYYETLSSLKQKVMGTFWGNFMIKKWQRSGHVHMAIGTIKVAGNGGYYWSKSISTGVYFLNFGNSVNALYGPRDRYFGFSLRCLQE